MTQHLARVDGGDLVTSLTAFLLVIVLTFFLCLVVGSGDDTVSSFLSANRSLSALRNGLAMCGDSISVIALLIPVGTVALSGHDGMVFTASTVAALAVLLVVAEPVRNTGAFTLGGILAGRVDSPHVRCAATVVTLLVCVPLIVVQLVVAGDATAYLLGLTKPGAAQVCTAFLGLLIVSFAVLGGLRATSVIEVVKVLLVLGTFAATAYLVLERFDFSLGGLLQAAATGSGQAERYFEPGQLYGGSGLGALERLSACLTLALGFGVLPPLLMRVSASRTGPSARRSVRHAVLLFGGFSAVMAVLGLGAAALVGGAAIAGESGQGYSAIFQLFDAVSGQEGLLFTAFACAMFVTALGSVAALTLAAGASLSHDVYVTTMRRGRTGQEAEVRMTRWILAAVGLLCVLLAVLLHNWSVIFFASFAAAVAASTILPALLYALFWRGLTHRGLLWTLYGGAVCCLVAQLWSPTVSGTPESLLPRLDFSLSPLENIAIVTVPAGFLIGWLTSRFGGGQRPLDYERTERSILTGSTY
ncbi:cation acetate symporter [Streptomyces sp. B93]|uniref:sodium:solute symporter family transporter n=1 Tax=Streptomyces sp. B93 TaxID=2824875 RepID=UPI001B3734AA|nr:cation acetate symporter [Streptomyces sp. B93]MBQ1092792.1 cation acetate symporter [Streptomyces sp. B93]